MARHAHAPGYAHPGARMSREELMHMLFERLVEAFRKLAEVANRTRKAIRRLFKFRMNEARARRKVLNHYSRYEHPAHDQQAPASLLEAYSVLGRQEYIIVKELGDAVRKSDRIPLSTRQKQSVRQIFASTSSDGPPNVDWHNHRSSKMRSPHDWAVMPAMA